MSSKVKLTVAERCPVMGVVYMPGTVEVDAETGALLMRLRPRVFAVAVSEPDETPAPEKRHTKPAKYKRKG